MKKHFIPLVSLVLATISLVTLKSIAPDLVYRQLLFFLLGALVFTALSHLNFEQWFRLSPFFYSVLSFVLLALLVVGQVTRGIRGWIPLFAGFKLQPSQFAVMVSLPLIGLISANLDLKRWLDLLKLIGLMILPGLLIVLEPDIGTGLVYLAAAGSLVLFLPIPIKKIMILTLVGLLLTAITWQFGLKPYQKQRITSFFSSQDQSFTSASQLDSSSYNSRQALIAVGSGRVYGRGLGFGVQSHLKFLPERQTDFIFASFAEEWGFIGASLVVAVYGVLILFLITRAQITSKKPQKLFIFGLAAMLFIQIFINIGMNLGLVPITGITLPLLSYGGSSIVAVLASLGLAQSIIVQQQSEQKLEIS